MAALPRPDQVQGHRGASAHAPENTLPAFRLAHDMGARWVEFDVALLGDGTPVVMHDETFLRCTGREAHLRDVTLPDLDRFDAGFRFAPNHAGTPVPTLAETLALLAELGLNANLEIKRHAYQTDLAPLVDAIAAAIAARPEGGAVAISSFDLDTLRAMRMRDAGIELAVLWVEPPADWLAVVAGIGAQAIHIHHSRLSPALLQLAVENGIKVRVWTCNDPALVADYWGLGLDAVITDDPGLFIPR